MRLGSMAKRKRKKSKWRRVGLWTLGALVIASIVMHFAFPYFPDDYTWLPASLFLLGLLLFWLPEFLAIADLTWPWRRRRR
jgi:hypothetical protein